MKNVDSVKMLVELLDYMKFQLLSGACTKEEIDSMARTLSRELNVRGSIRDFAEFYGQSESNVRNVISRRPVPESQKPKRQVTYRLGWFSTLIPNSWKHNN